MLIMLLSIRISFKIFAMNFNVKIVSYIVINVLNCVWNNTESQKRMLFIMINAKCDCAEHLECKLALYFYLILYKNVI